MKYLKFSGLFIGLFCLLNFKMQAQVQVPQVGDRLDFAGMRLHLTDQARRDIQSSVDALYRSEKHFNIMLEKVDLYMPLIEPIFEENGVPQEFKYLVIQESALVPDAISSSNAVGFWQFKESSATELNMRVDRQIDERMNIVSSTTGAAKYLLRSNAEFDNWLYTLLSYMMGQGGASRSVDKRHYGAREMKIDGDTHWYVKKFLSHMVAFENAVGKQRRNLVLYQYNNTGNKNLRQIANEFGAEEDQLLVYNKWLKTSQIPDDKIYAVVVPLNIDESDDLLAELDIQEEKKPEHKRRETKQIRPSHYPSATAELGIIEFNNKKGVVAREGDSAEKLAKTGGISIKRFRKFNDLKAGDKIQTGQFYYLQKKYRRARVHEHVLLAGENLWEISQRYGIRLKKLKQKNRLSSNEQPKPGRVLWLRYIRPANEPIEYREVKEATKQYYASAEPKTAVTTVPKKGPEEAFQPTKGLEAQKPQIAELEPEQPQEAESFPSDKHDKQLAVGQGDSFSRYPDKVLYPSDTLAPTQKEVQENIGEDLKLMPKDTANEQTQLSKIREKSEQNDHLKDNYREEEEIVEVQEELAIEDNTSSLNPEEEHLPAEEEGFSVNGPVNFVEDGPLRDPAPKDSVHEVKTGETLYSLSRQYNVSVQELMQWNKLSAQAVISVGQRLRIAVPEELTLPLEEKEEPEQKSKAVAQAQVVNHHYHTVSAGESMYRVARMYNVTIKDIMEWNNKESFDLREGEELIVGKAQE